MTHQPQTIQVQTLTGNTYNATLNDFPDECSVCHNKIIPKFMTAVSSVRNDKLQVAYQCTNQSCLNLIVATYDKDGTGGYNVKRVEPIVPLPTIFSKEISDISPMFVLVYNQAVVAEAMGLNQVVGIALRKAIEFLVKDYAIAQNSDEKDNIVNLTLGNCIEKYIVDANIKECVKRATWLGNDETHYFKKWEDKDIEDLKALVKISVNGLENLLLMKKYLREMPD